MKKSKKILSILLAVVMVLSAMSAMFVAFAANDDYKAELEEYAASMVPADVEFPRNYDNPGDMTRIFNAVLDMVAEQMGGELDLAGLLEDGVYTNATIGMVLPLYNSLAAMIADMDLGPTGAMMKPMILKLFGTETAIAGPFAELETVCTKLQAAVDAAKANPDNLDDKGNLLDATLPFTEKYAPTWEDGDWGFDDGDRDGFVNALLIALRPLSTLIEQNLLKFDLYSAYAFAVVDAETGAFKYDWTGLKTNKTIAEGEKVVFDTIVDDAGNTLFEAGFMASNKNGWNADGGNDIYVHLFPLFEALGFNLPTAEEYSKAYITERATNGNGFGMRNYKATDMLLEPVLTALFEKIDAALADPTNELADLLVSLATAVNTGALNASVKNVLDIVKAGLLGGAIEGLGLPAEFTAESINELLTAAPIAIAIDKDTTLNLTLKAIPFETLANCFTSVEVVESDTADGWRLHKVADFDKVFATLFYYVYDVAFSAENYEQIVELLKTLLPAETVDTLLPVIGGLASVGPVKALGKVATLLGVEAVKPEPPTTEEPSENPSETPSENPSEEPTEGNNTEDRPSGTPDAGDVAVGAFAAIALAAGAALVLTRKKK